MFRRLLIPCLLLALAGCSVTTDDCDPRNADAGLLTKFNCKTQGVYDQRVVHKQQVLLDEQQANQRFQAVYAAIRKEQAEVRSELNRQSAEYATLNQALNALLSDLKQRARGNRDIEARIARIEQDMARVNSPKTQAVMQKQYELQQLQRQVADLQADLGLQ